MKNMKLKSDMTFLTLSNVTDQSEKIRIEVEKGKTLSQAAIDAGISKSDSFDVFTKEGVSVTNEKVEDYSNQTLYVGPKKVAGGSFEISLDLEPSEDTVIIENSNEIKKYIVFMSAFDHTARHEVIPQEGQTLREAAAMAGLAPRDGSSWEVFTGEGVVLSNESADEFRNDVVYVGPKAIDAGALISTDLSKVKIDFPSIRVLNSALNRENLNLFFIKIEDKFNRSNDEQYHCIMDLRNGDWNTHIINLREGIRHPHVYTKSIVPGTNRNSKLVCTGNWHTIISNSLNEIENLSSYINHVSSVLNS